MLEVEVCLLGLFPVLVYFVRQRSPLFPLLGLLSKTSCLTDRLGLIGKKEKRKNSWPLKYQATPFSYCAVDLQNCWYWFNESIRPVLHWTSVSATLVSDSRVFASPAVSSAVAEGLTRSIVDTRLHIVDTLQPCKTRK